MRIEAGPAGFIGEWRERHSLAQTIVPLPPGTYHLEIAGSDGAGVDLVYYSEITVPSPDVVYASALILAADIQTVPIRNVGMGQFVIGDSELHPRFSSTFRRDEKLAVHMQIYNFGERQGSVTYEVFKAGTGEVVAATTEDIAKIPDASASQITIRKLLPLKDLAPGAYTLQVSAKKRSIHGDLTAPPAATARATRLPRPPSRPPPPRSTPSHRTA